MKITDQDYNHLTELVNQYLSDKLDTKQQYLNQGLSMMRYRWDVYRFALQKYDQFFYKKLYEYLDDNNIDSALRKITNTK